METTGEARLRLLVRNKLFTSVLLLLQFVFTEGEFRFCHEGTWHEITGWECPYGIYFNVPLTTSCFHSMGIMHDHFVPRLWPSPCDRPFIDYPGNRSHELVIHNDHYNLVQKFGEFQFLLYGLPGNLSHSPAWDDITTLQECKTSCHMKIVDKRDDHESSDSVEDLSRIRPKLNKTVVKQITDQTLRLGDYLYDQLMEQDPNPGPDLRIVRLFKKTMEVMRRTCQHPFIPNDFLTRVLYGFLFLVTDNGVGDVDDVTVEEYEDIMEALKICAQTPPNFRLEGKACSMVSTVERIVRIADDGVELTAEFKPNKLTKGERRFPYETYDIVIESAWQAVQVVHGSCFATFRPNANMHHRYTAAMEQLFGKKIMQRWRYPTQLIDPKMWGTWFLSDVDSAYFNTIACVRASYEGAPFAMKLDRPIDSNRNSDKLRRKKRSSQFNTMDEYWANYLSTGGIIKHLQDKITCFGDKEDRARVFQDYRQRICPDMEFNDLEDFGDANPNRPRPLLERDNPHGRNPNASLPIPTYIDIAPGEVNPIDSGPGTGGDRNNTTDPNTKLPIPTYIDIPTDRPGTGGDRNNTTEPNTKLPIPTYIDIPTDRPGTGGDRDNATDPNTKLPIPTYIDIPTDTGPGTGGDRDNATDPNTKLPIPTYIDLQTDSGPETGGDRDNDTDPNTKLPIPTYIDLQYDSEPETGGDRDNATDPNTKLPIPTYIDLQTDSGPGTGGDRVNATDPNTKLPIPTYIDINNRTETDPDEVHIDIPPGQIPPPTNVPPPGQIPPPTNVPPPGQIPPPTNVPPPGEISPPINVPPIPDSGNELGKIPGDAGNIPDKTFIDLPPKQPSPPGEIPLPPPNNNIGETPNPDKPDNTPGGRKPPASPPIPDSKNPGNAGEMPDQTFVDLAKPSGNTQASKPETAPDLSNPVPPPPTNPVLPPPTDLVPPPPTNDDEVFLDM